MKLNEFVEHIKHKSLSIKIYDMDNKLIYENSIGGYLTSVIKSKIGNWIIKFIYPEDNLLMIYLKEVN